MRIDKNFCANLLAGMNGSLQVIHDISRAEVRNRRQVAARGKGRVGNLQRRARRILRDPNIEVISRKLWVESSQVSRLGGSFV